MKKKKRKKEEKKEQLRELHVIYCVPFTISRRAELRADNVRMSCRVVTI